MARLSAEDRELIAELAGIQDVRPLGELPDHLDELAGSGAFDAVYTRPGVTPQEIMIQGRGILADHPPLMGADGGFLEPATAIVPLAGGGR